MDTGKTTIDSSASKPSPKPDPIPVDSVAFWLILVWIVGIFLYVHNEHKLDSQVSNVLNDPNPVATAEIERLKNNVRLSRSRNNEV
jgi:hypothetical protein